jgi:hypothetical protein
MGVSLKVTVCFLCAVHLAAAGAQPVLGREAAAALLPVRVVQPARDPAAAGGDPLAQDEPAPAYLPLVAKEPRARGYLTTPEELQAIAAKAQQGIEPYHSAVAVVLDIAGKAWDYEVKSKTTCGSSDRPRWIDNQEGVARLYARALAYHLTGEVHYAEEAKDVLERIMTEAETISLDDAQCRLNFGWGTPELVATADLIEKYWYDDTCRGPLTTKYGNVESGRGPCKELFQNWLVKNPYYVISYSTASQNNWGAAATNATAYIADYLADRPDVHLLHRVPRQVNQGNDLVFTPTEAYAHVNRLMFDRMNGYAVDYISSDACDFLEGAQQTAKWAPRKSQITETGIIPDDARREEACNIPAYDGSYQNYPQVHLGNNIQQCELMLRRGDSSCYDNVEQADLPHYTYVDPKGVQKSTSLAPGRGSIERAIKAIIVDSDTEWRHDAALAVAYHYYFHHHTLAGFEAWAPELDTITDCDQDICFGQLTHGFAPGELPPPVPITPEP